MKKITTEGIIKVAKQVVQENREHKPQFIAEGKNGLITAMLHYDDEGKHKMIEQIRGLVNTNNINKYWIVGTTWMSLIKKGEKMIKSPTRDADRTETLMVSEFSRELKNKTTLIPYNTTKENVVFEKAIEGSPNSLWNVYLESEGTEERINKEVEDINRKFVEKISRDALAKHREELRKAKTKKDVKKVFTKMALEGLRKMKEQNKTILEDVLEEESSNKKG